MKNIDEKIAKLREERRKERNKNLYEGIYYKGELWEFEETNFFDGIMSAMVPKHFVDMPIEIAVIKYPSQDRPQVIKTNDNGSINFALNYFEQNIKTDQIKEAAKSSKNVIKRVHPANIFYEEKEEKINNTSLCWFEFKSYAIDDNMYNLMFVTSIKGNVLMGFFNCSFDDFENLRHIALAIVMSIKELPKNKEVNNNECQ